MQPATLPLKCSSILGRRGVVVYTSAWQSGGPWFKSWRGQKNYLFLAYLNYL